MDRFCASAWQARGMDPARVAGAFVLVRESWSSRGARSGPRSTCRCVFLCGTRSGSVFLFRRRGGLSTPSCRDFEQGSEREEGFRRPERSLLGTRGLSCGSSSARREDACCCLGSWGDAHVVELDRTQPGGSPASPDTVRQV